MANFCSFEDYFLKNDINQTFPLVLSNHFIFYLNIPCAAQPVCVLDHGPAEMPEVSLFNTFIVFETSRATSLKLEASLCTETHVLFL